MKKQRKAAKQPRNWHAVNAHFRRSGSMGDGKKKAAREKCRKPVDRDD